MNEKYICFEEFEYDSIDHLKIKAGENIFVMDSTNEGYCCEYDDSKIFILKDAFKKHFIPDNPVELSNSQSKIAEILDSMKDLLIYKNQKYGDSALNPKNIFYKGDSTNSILIRLDDKLGRIMNNKGEIRTNDVCDLIGYLTLLLVSMSVNPEEIEKLKD